MSSHVRLSRKSSSVWADSILLAFKQDRDFVATQFSIHAQEQTHRLPVGPALKRFQFMLDRQYPATPSALSGHWRYPCFNENWKRSSVQESFYDHTLRKMSHSRVEGSFFTGYDHAIQHRQPLCFLPSVSPGLVHQGPVQGSQRSGAPACARHLPSSVPRERRMRRSQFTEERIVGI